MIHADISLSQSFQDMFDDVARFLPKLLAAVVILIVGFTIAKYLRRLIHKGFTKLGVDQLVDRSGLGGHLARAGYADSGLLLAKIIYLGLALLVLQLAIDVLDITAIKNVLDDIIAFVPRIVVALVIIFLTGAAANWVKGFVGAVTRGQAWGNAATNAAVISIWVIGIFAALDQVQVAQDVVDTLFTAVVSSLAAIFVLKFGIGGIWAARDRFWPGVYDRFGAATRSTSTGGTSPAE